MSHPMHGIRIIDLTRLLPGPMCSWILQGQGAEVIKIEQPGTGDGLRHIPPLDASGVSAWFSSINAGKKSVVLDLKQPAGRSGLHHLLAHADVLIEGFRPGTMARLGLDPLQLCARYPRLIVASISGFGQLGQSAQKPGHDLGYCAEAGALSLGAHTQACPAPPPLPIADIAGGALTAAFAISAALLGRERRTQDTATSPGARWLDISMTDSVVAMCAPMLAQAAVTRSAPSPGQELLTGGTPVYRAYRCADGLFLTLAALEPRFQSELIAQTGLTALTHEALEALFLQDTRDAWCQRLSQACVSPVRSLTEVLQQPQFAARSLWTGSGTSQRARPPMATCASLGPVPALGEHTEALLREDPDGASPNRIGSTDDCR